MSSPILPDIEAYGGEARCSALADILETQALSGSSMSRSQLTDYIADAEWGQRSANKFIDVSAEDANDRNPTATDLANETLECIKERIELLKAAYPFGLKDNIVFRRVHRYTEYDALLALSLAHGYNLACDINLTETFEEFVRQAFSQTGLRVASITGSTGTKRNFDENFRNACKEIGLKGFPQKTVRRRNAVDGGVDAILHFPLPPLRKSAWIGLCQATCAKTERWEAKIGQTAVKQFKKALNTSTTPYRLFAVPYHVQKSHLHFLEERHEAQIVDRLNLSACLSRETIKKTRHLFENLHKVTIDAPRAPAMSISEG